MRDVALDFRHRDELLVRFRGDQAVLIGFCRLLGQAPGPLMRRLVATLS